MRRFVFNLGSFFLAFVIGLIMVLSVNEKAIDKLKPPPEPAETSEAMPVELGPAKSHLIVAGQSVGRLYLGDSREQAVRQFGRMDTEYDYHDPTSCGEIKELRFWEFNDKSNPFFEGYGNGAWVYLRDNRIFQIKVQSEKLKTEDGITVMSDPQKVKRLYPDAEAYVELNSQSDVDGGDNLLYWIDSNNGIAFEFQYYRKLKKKTLAYVYIFEPNTVFYPGGCVDLQTQGWEKLRPFTLNEPISMQEKYEKEHGLRRD
jgi:hypothetical protein